MRKLMTKVPKAYTDRFVDLVNLTDAFCNAHLNDEYKELCRKMAVAVCQKGSPVLKGKPAGWAAGITYAIGRVNFLTDPSQSPHKKSEEIARGFGVSMATMQAKYRLIWEGLDLMQMDPGWSLPSRLDNNPLVWMLKVNGIIMDIRRAPRGAQVAAYEQGLIPYIPADVVAEVEEDAEPEGKERQPENTHRGHLYELGVSLSSGPVSESFVKKNRQVLRTIHILGDQTLADLHEAIFDAFDREEEHLYEFQIGGDRPMDPKARRYGLPSPIDGLYGDDKAAIDATRTTIESLGLKVEEQFDYWFDFGDDWWHQIDVLAIHEKVPRGRYPKLVGRTGDSPPQYMDWDEETGDDEDD